MGESPKSKLLVYSIGEKKLYIPGTLQSDIFALPLQGKHNCLVGEHIWNATLGLFGADVKWDEQGFGHAGVREMECFLFMKLFLSESIPFQGTPFYPFMMTGKAWAAATIPFKIMTDL